MSTKTSWAYLGLVLLGMGIGIGGTVAITNPQIWQHLTLTTPLTINPSQQSPASSPPPRQPALMPAPSNFVVDVVKETGASVVRINAERKVKAPVPEAFNDPFFRGFFGAPQTPNEQIQRGTGSGFIVSENGQILTNAHVVAGAEEVSVTLKDGRTLAGKVLGSDPTTDVAVVKVEGENLPAVKLGDANTLQVGEWTIAIGNPLGLDNTVTTGIVSATGRRSAEIGVADKRVEFIQTDAAINPGNSGGPLLNANGEVIGMNTAIIQNAQGLGFAIPINKAQQIAEQIISKGKVEHPYLGIQMVDVTPELKRQLQERSGVVLKADQGVLIMRVVPDSPAALAGVKAGDVIESINGTAISKSSQVQDLVEKTAVGADLNLNLIRDGGSWQTTLTIGVLPTQPQQP
jgi:S1-C subfamily serine protease